MDSAGVFAVRCMQQESSAPVHGNGEQDDIRHISLNVWVSWPGKSMQDLSVARNAGPSVTAAGVLYGFNSPVD